MDNTHRDAALGYAQQGWPVFSCNVNKSPKTTNGFKDATTDEQLIRELWNQSPGASIGIATGSASGLLIVDVDLPDGPNSLSRLEQENGPLPATLEQRTGTGGRHLFFKNPEGVTITISAGKIGTNLDTRCQGGYVIAPPSLGWDSKAQRETGTRYEWVNDLPITEAPGWLIDLILAKQTRVESIPSEGKGRPGDDFNSRGDIRPLLEEIDWSIHCQSGANERWSRPGKTHGTSATIFEDGSIYIFSGNAGPFEANKRYSPFAVYTILKHGGDYQAAAKALAREGYGEPTEAKTYRLTELGNAERFRDQHGDVVRFVPAWKKWISYDGRRWKIGADDQIRRMAHDTVKNLYAVAAQSPDSDMAQKIGKWAGLSCKSNAITALLKEASALLSIDPSILDANPWLFNCGNCTIDLKSGSVRPHQKTDWITKITPVNFDPQAKAPTFEKVVHVCLDDNRELISFLRRFAGYCLSGSTREQIILICWGGGANGKSTIFNAIAEALGDYALTTRPETLMVKHGDGIPSDLAKLKGARLVTAAEAEDGHRLAESQIKQMTGGEKIQARALYQDWFEYTPEFKIVLCTNHKPIIRGDDFAIWRRIRLVPFTVTIPEHERDADLPAKLKEEMTGILTWIVTGAAEWLTSGLGNPEEVRMATDCYQSEQSVINIFLDSCCAIKPEVMVEGTYLFQEFDKWRTREGQRKITQTKFGRMLTDLGFERSRSVSGRTVYQGIGLQTM